MTLFQFAILLSCTVGVGAQLRSAPESPMGKVIEQVSTVLRNCKKEAADEAKAHLKFACFCRHTTSRLSRFARKKTAQIALASAKFEDYHMTMDLEQGNSVGDKRHAEDLMQKSDETNERIKEEKTNFDNAQAEYKANKDSCTSAIKAMRDAGGKAGRNKAAFVQLPGIALFLAEADAMGLIAAPAHKAAVASLLQGKMEGGPMESYNYHGGSHDIIDLLLDLNKQMKELNDAAVAEHKKTLSLLQTLKRNLKANTRSTKRSGSKSARDGARAKSRKAMQRRVILSAQTELEDTDATLKDLTAQCEQRATEYDERSTVRKDEIDALVAAMACLTNAKKADQDRTFIQATPPVKKPSVVIRNKTAIATSNTPVPKSTAAASLSFLQEFLSNKKSQGGSFLQRGEEALSEEEMTKNVLALLSTEGRRLNSLMLTTLAAGAEGDPFAKVKDLVERLIQRLSDEALKETTKKGFCDEQVAKAESDRDEQFMMTNSLNGEIRGLEAKADALKESLKLTNARLRETEIALKGNNAATSSYKNDMRASLKQQKEGYAELQNAIMILKTFYSQAAKQSKAASFLEGPRRDREQMANFESSAPETKYSGQQNGMKSVFSLLESISSDFDREIRRIESNVGSASGEALESTDALKESHKNAEVQRDMDMQEAEETASTIKIKMEDLQGAADLLDAALKELMQLKPTCMDSGMSYAERVKARENEIKALQRAFNMLS